MKTILKRVARKILHLYSHRDSERFFHACTGAMFELKVARSLRGWRKHFDNLRGQKNLKLNVGCGPKTKKDWVNIDLHPAAEYHYDVRRGLPLESESCSIVYSEHFFEHLSYLDACFFIRESYRVLQPGGLFRVVLPDFPAIFSAYLKHDADYFSLLRGEPLLPGIKPKEITLIDYVNYAVYQSGEHLCLWDEEKMRQCLSREGFGKMELSQYQVDLDSKDPYRLQYSFYFQAIK